MEYKFKAWLKKEKKMVEVRRIDFYLKEIAFEYKGEIWIKRFDDIELLPCTNLKDKNGKEIYLGDIVNIDYGETIVKNAVVEYINASFYGKTVADLWELDNYCEIEVIGNKFENPELFETE